MRSVVAFVFLALFPFYASADVISIATDGVGNMGHAGTIEDPLEIDELISLAIVLNYNPHPSIPSYDGYMLATMDLSLQYSGTGTLESAIVEGPPWPEGGAWNHSGFDVFNIDDGPYVDISDGLDQISGGSLSGIRGTDDPTMLLWGFWARATGPGQIDIDLSLYGPSHYAPYGDGADPYPDPPGWIEMVEGDLGDLTLYVIPEPVTIALLGLGGLMLVRKRQRV